MDANREEISLIYDVSQRKHPRMIEMNNGDIFTVGNPSKNVPLLTVEFQQEEGQAKFYEVEEVGAIDPFFSQYERTGKVLVGKELNNYLKGEIND